MSRTDPTGLASPVQQELIDTASDYNDEAAYDDSWITGNLYDGSGSDCGLVLNPVAETLDSAGDALSNMGLLFSGLQIPALLLAPEAIEPLGAAASACDLTSAVCYGGATIAGADDLPLAIGSLVGAALDLIPLGGIVFKDTKDAAVSCSSGLWRSTVEGFKGQFVSPGQAGAFAAFDSVKSAIFGIGTTLLLQGLLGD